eukprot:1160220-Pelagomonas_calceolata.AAC.2
MQPTTDMARFQGPNDKTPMLMLPPDNSCMLTHLHLHPWPQHGCAGGTQEGLHMQHADLLACTDEQQSATKLS